MTPVCASMCRLRCSLCAGRATSLALIPARSSAVFRCRERAMPRKICSRTLNSTDRSCPGFSRRWLRLTIGWLPGSRSSSVTPRSRRIAPGPPGFPPQLHTLRGELQPLEDSWAWAHAQIMGETGDQQSQVDRLSVNHGPANLSRLLCPRKLTPLRSYLACLVPAFDCGVKAASGPRRRHARSRLEPCA